MLISFPVVCHLPMLAQGLLGTTMAVKDRRLGTEEEKGT